MVAETPADLPQVRVHSLLRSGRVRAAHSFFVRSSLAGPVIMVMMMVMVIGGGCDKGGGGGLKDIHPSQEEKRGVRPRRVLHEMQGISGASSSTPEQRLRLLSPSTSKARHRQLQPLTLPTLPPSLSSRLLPTPGIVPTVKWRLRGHDGGLGGKHRLLALRGHLQHRLRKARGTGEMPAPLPSLPSFSPSRPRPSLPHHHL